MISLSLQICFFVSLFIVIETWLEINVVYYNMCISLSVECCYANLMVHV